MKRIKDCTICGTKFIKRNTDNTCGEDCRIEQAQRREAEQIQRHKARRVRAIKAEQAKSDKEIYKQKVTRIECKECGLFEVVSDDPVLWWCPHCDCGTCRVCNKDLLTGKDKYNIFQSPHNNCVTLREPKALIEQAIEEGSKMRCPSCKLAGRKDDACTHMTCTKCSTSWCYVCGLDVLKCDKAP